MQEQAFLDELEQLGLLEIEDSVKWKMHRLDITQDFYVKCDPSLMVKSFVMQEALTRTGKVAHCTITSTMRSEAVNLKNVVRFCTL